MKITSKLIRAKSDFDYGRANGLGYVATIMQFAIFIKIFNLGRLWYFIVIPVFLIVTWAWGLVLRKINFRKRENNFLNEENPMIIDIHKAVKP